MAAVRVIRPVLGWLLRSCWVLLLAVSGARADELYSNGTIVSMDAESRSFEALGVRDGRIVAVGTKAAVAEKLRPGFTQIDLRGRTVPGFYAAHDHFPDSGLNELSKVDLNSPPIGAIRTMDG